MPQGDIHYLPELIEGAKLGLKTTADRLESEIQQLGTQLSAMHSTWDSQAHEAFTAVQTAWNKASGELSLFQSELGQAVGSAGDEMSATEQTNTNMFPL